MLDAVIFEVVEHCRRTQYFYKTPKNEFWGLQEEDYQREEHQCFPEMSWCLAFIFEIPLYVMECKFEYTG